MWFEELTGFTEDSVGDVAAQFEVGETGLTVKANGRRFRHGRFETPTLAELRRQVAEQPAARSGTLKLRELVADAAALHADPANAGSLMQVASQFNGLEMVSPSVTPEAGIDRYETDATQGPACAVACGAGTIYRNYLVPLAEGVGQRSDRQIDCLADLAAALEVNVPMSNGYALPSAVTLEIVGRRLAGIDDRRYDELLGNLRIALQWDTEVTLAGAGHLVSQAYCSALPVAYGDHPTDLWEPFARLVLDAAYEATFCAARLNAVRTGTNRVFLTLLGGGVFGNRSDWIIDAIARSAARFAADDLDAVIVSYRRPNRELEPLLSGRLGR